MNLPAKYAEAPRQSHRSTVLAFADAPPIIDKVYALLRRVLSAVRSPDAVREGLSSTKVHELGSTVQTMAGHITSLREMFGAGSIGGKLNQLVFSPSLPRDPTADAGASQTLEVALDKSLQRLVQLETRTRLAEAKNAELMGENAALRAKAVEMEREFMGARTAISSLQGNARQNASSAREWKAKCLAVEQKAASLEGQTTKTAIVMDKLRELFLKYQQMCKELDDVKAQNRVKDDELIKKEQELQQAFTIKETTYKGEINTLRTQLDLLTAHMSEMQAFRIQRSVASIGDKTTHKHSDVTPDLNPSIRSRKVPASKLNPDSDTSTTIMARGREKAESIIDEHGIDVVNILRGSGQRGKQLVPPFCPKPQVSDVISTATSTQGCHESSTLIPQDVPSDEMIYNIQHFMLRRQEREQNRMAQEVTAIRTRSSIGASRSTNGATTLDHAAALAGDPSQAGLCVQGSDKSAAVSSSLKQEIDDYLNSDDSRTKSSRECVDTSTMRAIAGKLLDDAPARRHKIADDILEKPAEVCDSFTSVKRNLHTINEKLRQLDSAVYSERNRRRTDCADLDLYLDDVSM